MRFRALGLAILASCTSPPEQAEEAPATIPPPTGATIEPSGHATILTAPLEPYPDAPPPLPGENEPQRMARETGISVSEAESRMNPDADTMRAAIALDRRLEREAVGNYVDVKIIRDPRPRYVFYFRRDAAETLARFTSDRRFQAVEGGVPAAELEPLFQSWMERLQKHRLVTGGAINAFEGEVELEVGVSRPEFERIAAQEGWRLPPRLKLSFAEEIDEAAVVAPDVAPFIRAFARADRAPGATLDIAIGGRIYLRDGCFRLDDREGGSSLVLFGRDTRLHRDAEGYMAVSSLHNSETSGRIGEEMIWGGYPAAVEGEPGVRALRAHCGNDPIASVGVPTSASRFRVRPWAIAEYARARGISRQQAWDEIKACWADQDAHRARARPGEMPPPIRQCDSVHPINPPPPPNRPGT